MQVSTTTLLNALHLHYNSAQPYQLDAGTSLAVSTWLSGGIVDRELACRAWEHARRRAEDGCIVLWFDETLCPRSFVISYTDSNLAQFINQHHPS